SASDLNMSKRTLDELFENKEVLLNEGMLRQQQERERRMKKIVNDANGDLLQILVSVFKLKAEMIAKINPAFYADLATYPRLVENFERSKSADDNKTLDFFAEGVRQGIFRDTVNYSLLIESFKEHTDTIVKNKLYNKYPMIDIFNSFTMVLIRGLVTEPALKRFEELYMK
ncbi:MAG: hypothetical protein Q4F34_02430, partial [Prevotellaceae bacterium]|nr:hypothetical protein [Prevotellaceae bacterium]